MRTPRQRHTVAGGALLLLSSLAWSLWTLLAPPKVNYRKTWFSVEFTTNNEAHPMHLTLPDGKEGMFDLMVVENLSDQPLSLLPFSSRPRIAGLPADQTMSAWAQWIASSRQGIIVEPHSTWFLNPSDLDRLPAFHGHTWINVFFSDARLASTDGLPATVLPPGFIGRFRIRYCLSTLFEDQIAIPQLHRRNLEAFLQGEVDATDKIALTLSARDISAQGGLSASGLR